VPGADPYENVLDVYARGIVGAREDGDAQARLVVFGQREGFVAGGMGWRHREDEGVVGEHVPAASVVAALDQDAPTEVVSRQGGPTLACAAAPRSRGHGGAPTAHEAAIEDLRDGEFPRIPRASTSSR
jgi:hypothetical protein